MKENLKEAATWIVFALLVGAAMSVGAKTVDYFWADSLREIIVKHEGGDCE